MKRRQFSTEFKTKIVLELLREEKTLSEIASEHDISPNQLRNWKNEFVENAVKVFSEGRDARESKANEKEMEQDRNDLLAKVNQLTIEVDWLKKKSAEILGLITRRNLLNIHSELSVTR